MAASNRKRITSAGPNALAAPAATGAQPPGQDPYLGYYPIRLKDGGAQDAPFAFHPFYRTLTSMNWYGPGEEEEMRKVFAEMARVARERSLDVRFVIIPTALQVLYPRIDMNRVDTNSPFAKEASLVVKNLNQLTAFAATRSEEGWFSVPGHGALLIGRNDAAQLYLAHRHPFTPMATRDRGRHRGAFRKTDPPRQRRVGNTGRFPPPRPDTFEPLPAADGSPVSGMTPPDMRQPSLPTMS